MVKRASSLFDSFCSNGAEQVTFFMLVFTVPPQIDLAQPITESMLRLITEKRSTSTGFGISGWIL